MKRKVVSLMLVSAMVAGMLAGCGSDSGSSKGGSSTETGSAAEASSSGETADDADDKSPITFEYFNADGKNGNWDNPVAKESQRQQALHLMFPIRQHPRVMQKKMLR